MSYRARRIDVNQPTIVKHFRKLGCSVAILSEVGKGIPDILVSRLRSNLPPWTALIEIKDGSKPPSARKLTPDEQDFHNKWQGELYIIESIEQVDALVDKILSGV